MLAIHGADPNDAHGIEAMLRRALGTLGLSRRAVLDRLERRWEGRVEQPALHALARLLHSPHLTPEEGLVSEAERHALLRLALIQEGVGRPLIVTLDDVHHSADAMLFVQTLMATIEALPVLFVLTARSEDLAVNAPAREALDGLLEAPRTQLLPVDALPAEDAARFVGEMLGFRGDLRGRVTQRIQGNPLFAVQLVADWVARGLLIPDGEGYHMAQGEPVPIPPDLRAVWDARLKTFLASRPAQDEVALEAAAALGGPIDPTEWLAVCRDLGAAPGDLLRDLLDQGLATSHEDGWDLVHGMLREALHERAKAADRWAALQMACARVLETGAHDRTRLGRHLLASGTTERAIPELMAGLEIDMRSGNLARAEETAHQVDKALGVPDTPVATLATAALQRAQLARLRGRINAATRELEWCDGAIDASAHPRLAALAATEAALIAYRAGDLQRVIGRSAVGEGLAREVDAVDLVGRCREVRARALTDRAEWAAARRTYGDAREAYEATGDELHVATCDLGLGWVACSEGAMALADQHIRSGLETFERLGSQEKMGTAYNMLGEAARARGAVDEAVAHYRRALELHDNCGATASATIAELNLSIVLVSADRTREARAGVRRRLRTMIGLGQGQFVDAARLVLLVCDAQEGLWEGWVEKIQAISAALAESGQVHEDLATLAELAAARATGEGLSGEAAAADALASEQRSRLSTR
jgi:tetratricopeptide (TPR) repeat protein